MIQRPSEGKGRLFVVSRIPQLCSLVVGCLYSVFLYPPCILLFWTRAQAQNQTNTPTSNLSLVETMEVLLRRYMEKNNVSTREKNLEFCSMPHLAWMLAHATDVHDPSLRTRQEFA